MSNVLKGIAQGRTEKDLQKSAEEQALSYFGAIPYGQGIKILWEDAETEYIEDVRIGSVGLCVEHITAEFTASVGYIA